MKVLFTSIFSLFLALAAVGQHDDQQAGHEDQQHTESHADHGHHDLGCGIEHHEVTEYEPGPVAFHHIADQNIFTIGPVWFHLPCILYAPETGLSVFSSGKFHVADHHGDGTMAVDRYVIHSGVVMRVQDESFPMGEVEVSGFTGQKEMVNGKEKEVYYVCYHDQLYKLDQSSTADGGLFGGGITSFYDFSITKNVLTMLIVAILLGWMFISIARRYRKRSGMAPRGVQSFMEPIYNFIKDDVAKAMIGPKYERFMPFIMALFFFILALNLIGQVPFLGNPNVTGNLAVTLVLAIFTFIVTNINGNGHYWQHIFWMPGIPFAVKLIMTPIEILGLFLKPITLMVRLFANITAGHIVVLSFVGLIFIFGQMGTVPAGGWGGAVISILLTLFMSAIELLVAFIQAFIFAILSASYIGMAVADDHH
ncbi:MAG: F0F1 ATP synthase subunit A [Saprospiraceae bacterium]|nr:F0F1 ATP synthase subunit A [Saprospiraceae bacterium]